MLLMKPQAEFLLDVCKLITYATSAGLVVTGGELYRTAEQQAIYVRDGKSKTSKSQHLLRLAIDLNFFDDDGLTYDIKKLSPIGTYWQSLHPKNEWGGFWKFVDMPHFERRL